MAATINIPLDPETAKLYADASADDQKKIQLLMNLWLREIALSPAPLQAVMDKISAKAQARGLTPEILESLLNGN